MNENALKKATDLECWSAPVKPEPLSGGLTNTNFVVEDRGERFVVRIGEDIPVYGVMRFNELAIAHAAHAAGISPEIVYQTQGAFVMRFIEGKTLTEEDVRAPQNVARVGSLLKKCHNDIPQYLQGPVLAFWPFQVCRSYLITAREGNTRMMDSLPHFFDINTKLEKTVGDIKMVLAHNDLLAANFIDDGQRLWLLDWDYAGYNSGLFDLASVSSNCEMSSAQETVLVEAYFEKTITDELRTKLLAMKCVSLLFVILWSLVSEIHSKIDFDYVQFTEEYITRFEKVYQDLQHMN